MLLDADHKYLVALNHFPKFGPRRLKKLQAHFPDWRSAFFGKTIDLRAAGLEENLVNEFTVARININPDALMEKLAKENIQIVALGQKNYPKLLTEIYSPPALLYFRGRLNGENEYSIAIIGSRKYTSYGQQATAQIARDLAGAHFTIVSGLALGIDAIAHEATLSAHGRTIAVLGSGLDRQSIYPSANRYLADKIIASDGAVVSEFPLGTPPLRHHFPQRNRIIAGLSLGTVVIEASDKSGALITAQYALDQNREVFALPGSIYSSQSIGPNKLIKQGAKPITGAHDIIETLDLAQVANFIENKKIIPDSMEEKAIITNLTHEPTHINDIIHLTGLDTSLINSTLIIMEMKGMIKNLGGMKYVLAH